MIAYAPGISKLLLCQQAYECWYKGRAGSAVSTRCGLSSPLRTRRDCIPENHTNISVSSLSRLSLRDCRYSTPVISLIWVAARLSPQTHRTNLLKTFRRFRSISGAIFRHDSAVGRGSTLEVHLSSTKRLRFMYRGRGLLITGEPGKTFGSSFYRVPWPLPTTHICWLYAVWISQSG